MKDVKIYEKIRSEVTTVDGSEYKVPISEVFGRGTLAKSESFGGLTLHENAQKTDVILQETAALNNIWNRSHSQWTWKHLNMTYHAPWKNMRQVAAELQSKRQALNDAKWRQVKNEIKIKKLEEKLGKELDYWTEVETKVKLAQLKEGMAEGMTYIEGAMKDVIALGEIYNEMKTQVESLTEEEFEKAEAESHLKRSLVQSVRDVRQYGSISKGEQEYLEQIGANPSRVQLEMRAFVQQETQTPDWSTNLLDDFVSYMCTELLEVAQVQNKRMDLMGFQESTDKSLCYDKLGEEDASN